MKRLLCNTADLTAFYKAFQNTRREMMVSLAGLFVCTILLSLIFYWVEHRAQPEVFDSWGSSLVWAYSRYIEGGDGVFEGAPATVLGRVIAFLLGVIGIAIVAIPAGLIGSGFIDAIAEEKREQELESFRENLELAFRSLVNVNLREYQQTHSELCPLGNDKSGFYLPSYVPLTKVQLRYGMSMKDVHDTTAKYPTFRLANLAAMRADEDNPEDRLVITHQYINRPYGCFIDRGSQITIVSASSVLETLTGWSAHQLAMAGGFNLISKEIEPSISDFDSFMAMTDSVKVHGYSHEQLLQDKFRNKKKLRLYSDKVTNREEFMKDLRSVCRGEDSWLLFINTAIMSQSNTDEFHFSMSRANGEQPTVLASNTERYHQLQADFANMVHQEFGYSAVQSARYPLAKGFPCYRIMSDSPDARFNAFRLNVGAPVWLDGRNMIVIHKMAQTINAALGGSGMTAYDAKYLSSRHYGWRDYCTSMNP